MCRLVCQKSVLIRVKTARAFLLRCVKISFKKFNKKKDLLTGHRSLELHVDVGGERVPAEALEVGEAVAVVRVALAAAVGAAAVLGAVGHLDAELRALLLLAVLLRGCVRVVLGVVLTLTARGSRLREEKAEDD
jgi:hypothetical protein